MGEDKTDLYRDAKNLVRDLRIYFGETIWRPLPEGWTFGRRFVRRAARYGYLIARGFVDSRILVRAPALTLITLLALVPLLALVFAAAKGFGLQHLALEYLNQVLIDYVTVGQQDLVETIIGYVENTRLRALGSIGLLFLIFTAISLLTTIEAAFNDIWGVAQGRPFYRKVVDYLAILLIFPVLLLAATGLTAGLSSEGALGRILKTDLLSGIVEIGVALVPLVVLVVGFTFLYTYMPHTTVKFRASIIAGAVAGAVWHIAQYSFIKLQFGVTQANLIYGTFAALPIFLIWLNVSWIIVLTGCEIAYAVQHEASYHPPVPQGTISIAQRERGAMQILGEVWKRFSSGKPPETSGDVAAEIDLPRPVTMEIVHALVQCKLLALTRDPGEGLLPARDLSHVGVAELLLAYRHSGRTGHGELGGILHDRVAAMHERLEASLCEQGSPGIDTLIDATRA